MFGWNDFGIDGKRWEENKRENSWEMCLVGRWRERENSWGATIFSSGPPNYNLSKIERKQERKFLCMCKEYLVFGALLLVLPFFFFPFSTPPTSFIHFGLLFIFFYFLFLVSSCFPLYTSIFFSFFFTSFLFLFPFFLKFIYSLLHPLFASISFFFSFFIL